MLFSSLCSFFLQTMLSPSSLLRLRFLLFLLHFQILVSIVEPKKLPRPFNNTVSALFVFGDSTVDPGNNNYIDTPFRGDFPPYGLHFPNQVPTGRFSDGRLVTDFLAEYVGIKENIPPFLNKKLSLEELKTGVSFASAGSGLDHVTTDMINVIPMKRQKEHFHDYKKKLVSAIGKEKAQTLISKAGFIISAGVNDFAISYYVGARKMDFTIPAYEDFLLSLLRQFIEDLKKEGARLVGVVGLPPMGCVPLVITITGKPGAKRRCNESLSAISVEYNKKLIKMLKDLDKPNFKVFYADIYNPVEDMVKNPSKYGFEHVDVGCCGTGLLEMTFLCNPQSHICSEPYKHMFFDSVHGSEATYRHVFNAARPTIDRALKEFSH